MKPIVALLLALSLPLLGAGAATAQTTAEEELRAEIEALKRGQEELRREVQALRTDLQKRPTPQAAGQPGIAGKVFDLGDNPVRGEAAAGLTLIEFLDYQ